MELPQPQQQNLQNYEGVLLEQEVGVLDDLSDARDLSVLVEEGDVVLLEGTMSKTRTTKGRLTSLSIWTN